ncbi:MAG: NlpC/P60 family protein [Bacteroidota bacterium]
MLKTLIRLSALLLLLTQACSPRASIQKYAYLTDRLPVPQEQKVTPKATKPIVQQKNQQPAKIKVEIATNEEEINLLIRPKTPVIATSSQETEEAGIEYSYTPAKHTKKGMGQLAVDAALSYMGTPYKYGGNSRKGIDCSALMMKAYKKAGLDIPRNSAAQSECGRPIKKENVRPGDLVFFDSKNRKGRYINHVGMVYRVTAYKTEFIHASSSKGVRIDFLEDPYWKPRFRKAVIPKSVKTRGGRKKLRKMDKKAR